MDLPHNGDLSKGLNNVDFKNQIEKLFASFQSEAHYMEHGANDMQHQVTDS